MYATLRDKVQPRGAECHGSATLDPAERRIIAVFAVEVVAHRCYCRCVFRGERQLHAGRDP